MLSWNLSLPFSLFTKLFFNALTKSFIWHFFFKSHTRCISYLINLFLLFSRQWQHINLCPWTTTRFSTPFNHCCQKIVLSSVRVPTPWTLAGPCYITICRDIGNHNNFKIATNGRLQNVVEFLITDFCISSKTCILSQWFMLL